MSDGWWSCPTCHAPGGTNCHRRTGEPRKHHLMRRALGWVNALLDQHAHRLPLDDRLQLAHALLTSQATSTTAGPVGGEQQESDATSSPDWLTLWHRLVAESGILYALQKGLAQPHGGIEFSTVIDTLGQSSTAVNEAHEACGTARNLGLTVPAGIGLRALRRAIAVAQADLVDAGLRERHRPELSAATALGWTIDYQAHGGFVAHPAEPDPEHRQPSRFHGAATTPLAAADIVTTWFSGLAAITVTFAQPLSEHPPLAPLSAESTLSGKFADLKRTLDQPGTCYREMREACAQTRDRLRTITGSANGTVDGFLAERARWLNEHDPQLPLDSDLACGVSRPLDLHKARIDGACWVPTHLVVATGHDWGEFGDHRPEVPGEIAHALASTTDLDGFLGEFYGHGPIDLLQVPAWAGPLYLRSANGSHRIHTARLLDLPWLAATVTGVAIPVEFDLTSLCANDRGNPLEWHSDENFDQRVLVLNGLIHRGVIDGDIVIDDPDRVRYATRLRCRYLPAPWLVRNPQHAVRVNQVYESRYPGALAQLGIPLQVGTQTDKWIDWLVDACR
jgi:hypothetical protein